MKLPNISEDIDYKYGKNAQQNTLLIQNSNEKDMWFHIENSPSAHIVVSIPEILNKKQKKTVIKWGAMLCKQRSKITSKCTVMYTQIKDVHCTNVPGTVTVDKYSSLYI